MKKKLIIAGLGMLPWLAASAQQQDTTLVRTVVVENEYNPTVMDASKINVLPKVEEPTVPKTHIDYSTSIRPVASWNYQAMNPIVKDWTADAAYRGYLRAGYGNNGNVDAQLGYLWDITKKDRLNVAASLDGWNMEQRHLYDSDWMSRLYNTKVGLDYRHSFRNADILLGGYYRSQVFNYMDLGPIVCVGEVASRSGETSSSSSGTKQHQTLANVYVGLNSMNEEALIQYKGEIGMNYFKQKYPTMVPVLFTDDSGSETNLYVKGDLWKSFEEQSLGLNLEFNNYSYSMEDMENAISMEFNPYYKYENDDWRIRFGAHADWWSGIEDKVRFAPDVKVEYIFSDKYMLYAKAGGGNETKSMLDLTNITPYWNLHNNFILPTYVSLDAALGLKASPANGWWFNLTGGYQIRTNDMAWMIREGYVGYCTGFVYGKAKVAYGSIELKYDYKDLFDLALKGTYYSWKMDEVMDQGWSDEFLMSLKPELEMNAEVGFKPIEGLRVNVGYEYVKRASDMYDPINNLYAGADYALLKNLSVFAKVNNLLNKEYVRHDAYPDQKLNFLGGISLQF